MAQEYRPGQRYEVDGSVYEYDGRVWNYVGPAQQAQPQPVRIGSPDPRRPYQVRKDAADAVSAEGQAPYAAQIAESNARKSEADARKAEAEAAKGPQTTSPEMTKGAQIRAARNLLRQLDQQEALFRDSFTSSNVWNQLGELNPLDPNVQRFNTFSNNEKPYVKQFMRVPGEGAQSDKDAADYSALLPNSSVYDSTNIERFRNLRESANAVLRDNGLPVQRSQVFDDQGQIIRRRSTDIPGIANPATGFDPGGPRGPNTPGPGEVPMFGDEISAMYAGLSKSEKAQIDAARARGVPKAELDAMAARMSEGQAPRWTPEQEAQVRQAARDGDAGLVTSLMTRFSGGTPPSPGEVQKAIKWSREGKSFSFNYSNADEAYRQQRERELYGTYLPGAVESRKGGLGQTDSLIRATANGVFPWADPLAAWADSTFTGRPYEQARQEQRALSEADRRVNPKLTFTGNVVGGAAGAGALESLFAKAGARISGPFGAGLRSPIAADATYGAAQSWANDGNPLLGAGAGALGGMFGRNVVGPALGATARAAAVPVRGATNAMRRALGGSDLPPLPTRPDAGARTIVSAANRSDDIVSQLEEAQRLGVPMSLADTSAALRSLGGAAVRRSPEAEEVALGALIPRSRGQFDRFSSALERDLGPVGNVPQLSDDLAKSARAAAAPLYEQAYIAPGASAFDLSKFAGRPSFEKGLSNAYRIAKEEGRDPMALGFRMNDAGDMVELSNPSWQTLDYTKRGMDDVIESYRDPTTGRLNLDTEGRAANDTLRQFMGAVDTANPDYAAARAAFSGPMQAREALARGYRATNANPNQLGVTVGQQTPEQLAQMQLGFRGGLMDQAERVRYSSNPFETVLGTPAAERRVAAMFPDVDYGRLFRTRDLESNLARSTNDIIGNSKTAQRMLADQEFGGNGLLNTAVDAGVNLATGQVPTGVLLKQGTGKAIKDAWTLGVGKRAREKAERMAPILFDTDATSALANFDSLVNASQLWKNYVTRYNRGFGTPAGMFGAPLLVGTLPTAQ